MTIKESVSERAEVPDGASGLESAQKHTGSVSDAPYPLFIWLKNRRVVVVGAGSVAQRKIETLLEYGANVVVVAPRGTQTVERLADDGKIVWLKRPYKSGDLDEAYVVFAATSDSSVNRLVFEEAEANRIPVNVVDVPELCSAIVPSIMRRGKLQVAVSTGGASPTTAREVRRFLENEFDEYWGAYIDLLAEVRGLVKNEVSDLADRTNAFESLAKSDLRQRFESGETLSARMVYDQYIRPVLDKGGE